MGWLLQGRAPLHPGEGRYADHPDIPITPGLLCHPLDQVVGIPLRRTPVFRFSDPSGVANHMHVASGNKVLSVSGFHAPLPQRGPGWLGWNGLGNIRGLQVFIVNGKSQNCREFSRSIRTVDIDAYMDSIAHGDHDISVLYHFFIQRLGSLRTGRFHFLIHFFLLT
jgi:hypothetical protein